MAQNKHLVEKANSLLETNKNEIQSIQRLCLNISAKTAEGKGFWEGKEVNDRFPEAIALIHSELSEALEAHRNDNHKGKDSVLEELADAMIRIYDLAYHYEISEGEYFDLQLTKKMEKNLEREVRHGKKY